MHLHAAGVRLNCCCITFLPFFLLLHWFASLSLLFSFLVLRRLLAAPLCYSLSVLLS